MTDNPTPSDIARRLTTAQREAMAHPNGGDCAYRWATTGTLTALNTRNLVKRLPERGSMFSPQTAVKWPFTTLGLAVRAILQEQTL